MASIGASASLSPPDNRLQGRVAIVTGSSSGLGRAIALKFASAGAKVVCADVRPAARPLTTAQPKENGQAPTLLPTHELINQTSHAGDSSGGGSAEFVQTDVTDETAIQALVARAVSWGGTQRLDIMVNNAGISAEVQSGLMRRLHETPLEDYERTHAVNQRAVWLGCKHAAAQMLKQEPRQEKNARGERPRGCIINTASVLGLVASAGVPCYVPTKHAVIGITKQVAVDYAKDRIRCNCLCPGYIKTSLTQDLMATDEGQSAIDALHPWGSLGLPEDIADAALFLASDESSWVTGHAMRIDGGYTAQ